MAILYDGNEIKEEDKRQSRDDLILQDPKKRKPWHTALLNLKDVDAPEVLLQWAENNPRVALVDPEATTDDDRGRLWEVKSVLWNGTIYSVCTTDWLAQWNCEHKYGWEVKEEKNAVYKYSKWREDDPELRPLFEWIYPPDIWNLPDTSNPPEKNKKTGKSENVEEVRPSMLAAPISSGSTDMENVRGKAFWKKYKYQRILWLNIKVRELLPEELKKAARIDTDKVFLPAEGAKRLLDCVDKGKCKVMDELREWLERSIKAGQAEGS